MNVSADNTISTFDIPTFIDKSKISVFQIIIYFLCGICLIIDGFDALAMAYVAPAIIQEWGVDKATLGPVFSASLFGMLVGSLTLSILGDKYGRRPVLILSTLFFAVCMLLTPTASTITGLITWRFLAGLGLGCIMPNAMALAGEFAPQRSRVTIMMWVSAGFTIGAAFGGFLASLLIPAFGWESVFIFGGFVPVLIVMLMMIYLPESLQLMVLKNGSSTKLSQWIKKIDPHAPVSAQTQYHINETGGKGSSIAELFTDGRMVVTLLFWLVNFMNLLNLYFLSNWLPTLLKTAGYSTSQAILASTSLWVGGVVGTILLGRFIDKLSFSRVLTFSFALAALTIALIGQPSFINVLPLLVLVIFLAGFGIIGGQPALNAFAAKYYPTHLRSTGIGWSLGVGRVGSVIGPILGGALLQLKWTNSALFLAAAIPAIISMFVMMLLRRTKAEAQHQNQPLNLNIPNTNNS